MQPFWLSSQRWRTFCSFSAKMISIFPLKGWSKRQEKVTALFYIWHFKSLQLVIWSPEWINILDPLLRKWTVPISLKSHKLPTAVKANQKILQIKITFLSVRRSDSMHPLKCHLSLHVNVLLMNTFSTRMNTFFKHVQNRISENTGGFEITKLRWTTSTLNLF